MYYLRGLHGDLQLCWPTETASGMTYSPDPTPARRVVKPLRLHAQWRSRAAAATKRPDGKSAKCCRDIRAEARANRWLLRAHAPERGGSRRRTAVRCGADCARERTCVRGETLNRMPEAGVIESQRAREARPDRPAKQPSRHSLRPGCCVAFAPAMTGENTGLTPSTLQAGGAAQLRFQRRGTRRAIHIIGRASAFLSASREAVALSRADDGIERFATATPHRDRKPAQIRDPRSPSGRIDVPNSSCALLVGQHDRTRRAMARPAPAAPWAATSGTVDVADAAARHVFEPPNTRP